MTEVSFPDTPSLATHRETFEDPLEDLQLRVARRADELAAAVASSRTPLNLLCWLQAEEEILHRLQHCGNALKSQARLAEPVGEPQDSLGDFFRLPDTAQGGAKQPYSSPGVSEEASRALARA